MKTRTFAYTIGVLLLFQMLSFAFEGNAGTFVIINGDTTQTTEAFTLQDQIFLANPDQGSDILIVNSDSQSDNALNFQYNGHQNYISYSGVSSPRDYYTESLWSLPPNDGFFSSGSFFQPQTSEVGHPLFQSRNPFVGDQFQDSFPIVIASTPEQ